MKKLLLAAVALLFTVGASAQDFRRIGTRFQIECWL